MIIIEEEEVLRDRGDYSIRLLVTVRWWWVKKVMKQLNNILKRLLFIKYFINFYELKLFFSKWNSCDGDKKIVKWYYKKIIIYKIFYKIYLWAEIIFKQMK
jgi:hypothetical protein